MAAYTTQFIPNGELDNWDAGPVPTDMDTQTSNTTLLQLQRSFVEQHPARHAWDDIAGRGDKFTYSGQNSLRATYTGEVVDAFRLHPEGINATAWTGASTRQILLTPLHVYAFSCAARCSVAGNLLRMRVVLRDTSDGVQLHLQQAANPLVQRWTWATTDADPPDFGLTTRWARYTLVWQVPITDGTDEIENAVWQISNGSTGTQIIDLDDIRIEDLTLSRGAA